MEDCISIPEFFDGRSVFVTGGSGFMGKVLIEKLLRSCSKLENLYMLIRDKKGKSPEDRIKQMLELPLFKVLLEENPDAVKKIRPIIGDVMKLGLGLSENDRKLLIDKVSIVYHAAASVRFDDHLTDAIILNTRGTREVCLLARQMKNIAVLAHFSTTYCHTDRKVIGEEIYPAHADWRDAIKLAENVDRFTLDLMTRKYIEPLPNTYTFTKSLAEQVVHDLCDGVIPSLIFRPSIVISTWKDPFPGWIDNFNGPVALLLGVGKGVLRTLYTNPNIRADFIPVDLITKGIIVGTWNKAIAKETELRNKLDVFNCSQCDVSPVNMQQLIDIGMSFLFECPANGALWFPRCSITNSPTTHFLKVIFYHLLPALLIDGLLKLTGHKTILMKVQRRVYTANLALEYFITNEWKFMNDKGRSLEKLLLPIDSANFGFNVDEVDVHEYFKTAMYGGRQYLLKQGPETLEQGRREIKRLWLADRIVKGVFYIILAYSFFFLVPYAKICKDLSTCVYDYLSAL